MASANSTINVTSLDFDDIKTSLKDFLKSQNTLKDYNYEGSALSVLLDVLSYNTQYNAYYLNMVANEMFLDTALKRSSVVSHAKLLNYTPKSAVAPTATINLVMNNVNDTTLTLPKNTKFLSEAIDGINYTFVTTTTQTVETDLISRTATFNNVLLKQGDVVTTRYTVDSTSNPKYIFELPDPEIDISTLTVTVQESSTNNYTYIYNLSETNLNLTPTSQVFFIQEGLNENYEMMFGDDVLGKKLKDGNIIIANYLITRGSQAQGANNFTLMDSLNGYTSATITGLIAAGAGKDKETIESIKYQAPRKYSSQGRAVTKDDYISIIQQNNLGIPFDAVSVWGGEENNPPAYGQVFISLKPTGSYILTDTQKQAIIRDVIKPISMLTVTPTIVDPDYTYLKLTADVLYDPKKTTLSKEQLKSVVANTINNFADTNLNTFNSVFKYSDLVTSVQASNPSIITTDVSLKIQKKVTLDLTVPKNYTIKFGVPLERGIFLTGISSSPAMTFRNPTNLSNRVNGVYLEEIASPTGGISSIELLNPGFNYTQTPKVTIIGDGTGAEAVAVLDVNNTIKYITVTNKGTGYTSAVVKIENDTNDKTGQSGSAVAILEGRYGTLRSYYNDANNYVKVILNNDVGTIDYQEGTITLNNFTPLDVDDPLGQLTITVKPSTKLLASEYNKIITVDPFDISSVTVNVTAQ